MRENSINKINKKQRGPLRIPVERTKSLFKGSPKTKPHNKDSKKKSSFEKKNKKNRVNEKCMHIDAICVKTKTN